MRRERRRASKLWEPISFEQLQPLSAKSPRVRFVRPVTFPPGRARLATRPASTGSVTRARHNDGDRLSRILRSRDPVGDPPAVTMISTLRRTSSAASRGARSGFPSAYRYSMAMFCPLDVAKLAREPAGSASARVELRSCRGARA